MGAPGARQTRTPETFRRAFFDALLGSLVMWGAALAGIPLHANATIMGLAFLVVVLGVAIARGLLAGTVASVAGVAFLNYYFIPPVGWAIEEPEDLTALGCFLIASTVASRLVVVARQRAAESEARGREVRVLYELSVELFGTSGRESLATAIGRALERLGASGGSLLVVGEESHFFPFGEEPPGRDEDGIVAALASGVPLAREGTVGRDVDVPLVVDGRAAGVLSVRGTPAALEAVESAGRLVALALERERLLSERLHLEALRESDALKTSLLRAVSHDLRTPLTAIRLKIESLRRLLPTLPQGMEALGTMTREVDNLKHRIDNLLSMARLQAGMSSPKPEPSPPADLFRAAREGLESILEGRSVRVAVSDDCPDVLVDPSLAVEILINLLENAAHAAPAGTPLELHADRRGAAVRLAVLDRGPGLPRGSPEPIRPEPIGPAEGRGEVRRGMGLEIARGLAAASGGVLALEPRPGGGTVAAVTLPAFQPLEVRTA